MCCMLLWLSIRGNSQVRSVLAVCLAFNTVGPQELRNPREMEVSVSEILVPLKPCNNSLYIVLVFNRQCHMLSFQYIEA